MTLRIVKRPPATEVLLCKYEMLVPLVVTSLGKGPFAEAREAEGHVEIGDVLIRVPGPFALISVLNATKTCMIDPKYFGCIYVTWDQTVKEIVIWSDGTPPAIDDAVSDSPRLHPSKKRRKARKK